MKTVSVKKREINIAALEDWIVEDTHDFDTIVFTIDENLSGLHLFLLYKNRNDEGGVEKLDGNTWIPSQSFTAVRGSVRIQLIAVDGEDYPSTNSIRWSSRYSTITVHENIEADVLVPEPEESVMESVAEGMV